MKKIIIISILSTLTFLVNAQDFHVSQFDVLTLYYNPALTAVYDKADEADYKAFLTHRSQWNSLGVKPFKTYSLGYDMRHNRFGMGALLLNNRSGIGGFNSFSFLLSGSYFIIEDAQSPHTLTAGLQMGLLNKSVNPDSYLFESQLNTTTNTLDENMSSGEAFNSNSKLNFDANIGIFYSYNEEEEWYKPFIGFSIYHITRPNESITSTASKLPMRFNLNLGSKFIVSEKVTLTPNILYMYQAKATELNMGFLGTYKIKEENDIIYGLAYRLNDAFIMNLGFRKDNITFRMSYDATTSSLSNYNSGRGAYEFSLIVTGKKGVNPFQNVARFN
ncbi:MAG TPA: PorP/SprF family type IX secretion system membrane protein [Vicingaceae bacterium]